MHPSTRILAFSGRPGSGKDTLGAFLRRNSRELFSLEPEEVVRYAFADYLKEICLNLLMVHQDTPKSMETHVSWPETGERMTARELYQYLGTDVFRALDDDCWARYLMIKISMENPKLALITDCRFANEMSWIWDEGGKVIRLTRHRELSQGHIAEKSLDAINCFDAVLDNEGKSLDETCKDLVGILRGWGWTQS